MDKKGALYWKVEKVISKGKYNYVIVRNHPKATANGYVLEHRIVMENHLGRLLEDDEIVHHKNGDKKDNRIENLIVMKLKDHSRIHALRTGRKFVDLKCPECKTYFSKEKSKTHLNKGGRYTACSKKCRGIFSHRLKSITIQVQSAISENVQKEYRFWKTPRELNHEVP